MVEVKQGGIIHLEGSPYSDTTKTEDPIKLAQKQAQKTLREKLAAAGSASALRSLSESRKTTTLQEAAIEEAYNLKQIDQAKASAEKQVEIDKSSAVESIKWLPKTRG